jgi:hypothetical protein
MRGIIFCVIAVTLFTGSSARAAAGDDDKNARSSEKSSPSGDKKPSESARPGTDAGSNPSDLADNYEDFRQRTLAAAGSCCRREEG